MNSETGQLTTHVLDTAQGRPASSLRIELFRLMPGRHGQRLCEHFTNSDGRVDVPLLYGEEFRVGSYQLLFHTGEYFEAQGFDLPEPPFLDEVVVRFGIADERAHYHVPLLVSPWSYSTYRGS